MKIPLAQPVERRLAEFSFIRQQCFFYITNRCTSAVLIREGGLCGIIYRKALIQVDSDLNSGQWGSRLSFELVFFPQVVLHGTFQNIRLSRGRTRQAGFDFSQKWLKGETIVVAVNSHVCRLPVSCFIFS